MFRHLAPRQASAELLRAMRGTSAQNTTATFREWAIRYAGTRDSRFLVRLIDHFGDTPLAEIDQVAIDRAAQVIYPFAAPSTVNRQCHSPIRV